MKIKSLTTSVVIAFWVAGCATFGDGLGKRPEAPNQQRCLELYATADSQIDAAGVRDAAYARVRGFPYLRVDRYSASFIDEISDRNAFELWVASLRANEDESRDIELRNLGLPKQKFASLVHALRSCGDALAHWELEDATFREKLLARLKPADHYSTLARTLGVYPLAALFLEAGAERFEHRILADYAKPMHKLKTEGELLLWTVAPPEDSKFQSLSLREKPRDRLGRFGMPWSDVVQLARFHAPELLIDTRGEYDLPGVPVHSRQGPTVDTARPAVYFLPALTRFGGRSLLQINYFVWFSLRPERGIDDYAAGKLDGLIWRVTLDESGEALLHDTIHACGCYHFGFPTRALPRRRNEHPQHAMLLPQKQVPGERIAVRIQSGTHSVQRVLRTQEVRASSKLSYALRRYEELLSLPHPDGGTRSLFGEEGLVAGSERSERFWLWPSGIKSPGAMRQWGSHATSFVGKAYFDDPFLLEEVFVPDRPGGAAAP